MLTIIDCVVSLVDQILPVALLEVKVTLSPEQKVSGPFAVTEGVAGSGFTVTLVVAEVSDWQSPSFTSTQYAPVVETVIDWVVSFVDQRLPVGLLEVKVTLSPAQNVNGPLAVIEGVAGAGFTVTTTGADSDVQPKMFRRLTV